MSTNSFDDFVISVHQCGDNCILTASRIGTTGTEGGRTPEEKEAASLASSLSRMKSTVLKLAMANQFETWFTLNGPSLDMRDINKIFSWFRSHSRYRGFRFSYLMVIAPNTDGNGLHLHGLCRGIPADELVELRAGSDIATDDQTRRIEGGLPLWNWQVLQVKFPDCSHEIQRFGDVDLFGRAIEQFGKSVYAARQYDKVPLEHIPAKLRKVRHSRDLVQPERTHLGSLSGDDLKCVVSAVGCGEAFGALGGRVVIRDPSRSDDILRRIERSPSYCERDGSVC